MSSKVKGHGPNRKQITGFRFFDTWRTNKLFEPELPQCPRPGYEAGMDSLRFMRVLREIRLYNAKLPNLRSGRRFNFF